MVYILLVDGFEEIEAIEPLDIMRRAGIEAHTVGVFGKTVKGAHDIFVEADMVLSELNLESVELLMLPGGPGHTALMDAQVLELVQKVYDKGKKIAAICAAPSVLGKMGLLKGKRATCYPGFEQFLTGAEVQEAGVVYDAPFLTGKGPGAAAEFGFALVRLLKGVEVAEKVRGMMQY